MFEDFDTPSTTDTAETSSKKSKSVKKVASKKVEEVKPAKKVAAKKVEETKPVKKAVAKKEEAKPAKKVVAKKEEAKPVKKAKAERVGREGSVCNSKLQLNTDVEFKPRAKSIPAMLVTYFKKPTVPNAVMDDILSSFDDMSDIKSTTAEKNGKAYMTWYLLHLVRKGILIKVG